MTRRVLLGLRLALLLLATTPALGCGGPTQYALKVDSPAAPFKPTDPDDLVVSDDDDDDDDDGDEDKGDADGQ